MAPADNRPSKKQHELLSYIRAFIGQNGYGPSYREIMKALNYKSVSTVAVHVDNLIQKGQLRKRDKSARSLEVSEPSLQKQDFSMPAPTSTQQKWLIDMIAQHFTAAEQKAQKSPDIDHLFVLVGALHILGFPEAARSYQARLGQLKKQLPNYND